MIAEFRIYLEQNFCLSKISIRTNLSFDSSKELHEMTHYPGGGEWEDCKALVEEHFTGMHTMAMEKFFIPTEICNQVPTPQMIF